MIKKHQWSKNIRNITDILRFFFDNYIEKVQAPVFLSLFLLYWL